MTGENRDDRFGLAPIHRAGREQCGLDLSAALVRFEAVRFHDGAHEPADVSLDGTRADAVAEHAQDISCYEY